MIANDLFIREIQSIFQPDVFQLNFTKVIAGWCNNYYEKYDKSPKRYIEDIFEEEKKSLPTDQVDLIEEFLKSISHEYEKGETFNALYILDKAEKHFNFSKVIKLKDELNKKINNNDLEGAQRVLGSYEKIKRPESSGVDPYRDKKVIIESLADSIEENPRYLFTLPGALGYYLGPLMRKQFNALIGMSNIGKTWWLQFIAKTSLLSGFDTLYVSMEMPVQEMTARIQHDINALPSEKWAGDILIPVFDCKKNQDDTCTKGDRVCGIGVLDSEGNKMSFEDSSHDYCPCTSCRKTKDYNWAVWYQKDNREKLTIADAIKKRTAMDNTLKRAGKFHLVEFPSGTKTMDEFDDYLYNLEYYEDFIPSVIITDYADKFKIPGDYRHGVGEIWQRHKSMAQERNAMVFSASQSNTARTGKDAGQGTWAESIEKFNLLDIGFGINQKTEEKKEGFYRINTLKQRHDDFDLFNEIIVLQNLKIGRPYLDSYVAGRPPKKTRKSKKK